MNLSEFKLLFIIFLISLEIIRKLLKILEAKFGDNSLVFQHKNLISYILTCSTLSLETCLA